MIITSTYVEVGTGYRLLDGKERPQRGDDVVSSTDNDQWRPVIQNFDAETVEDIRVRLKPFNGMIYYRRKMNPSYGQARIVINQDTGATRDEEIAKLTKEVEDATKLAKANEERIAQLKKEKLEEDAKKPITVLTTDNVPYTAQIFESYVDFGCARIGIQQLLAAKKLLSDTTEYADSNRKFTSILIGKGIFTLDIIERLIRAVGRFNKDQFKIGDYIFAFNFERKKKWTVKYRLTEIDTEGFTVISKAYSPSMGYAPIPKRCSFSTHQICAQ